MNWHHAELGVQFVVVVCGVIVAGLVLVEFLLWLHARRRAKALAIQALHTMREGGTFNHVIVKEFPGGDTRLRPVDQFTHSNGETNADTAANRAKPRHTQAD